HIYTLSLHDALPIYNGKGFPAQILKDISHNPLDDVKNGGIGIYNVNKRLISLLGETSRLTIRNLPSGGSEVFFSIPRKNRLERQDRKSTRLNSSHVS